MMSPTALGLGLFAAMMVLMALRMPVAAAMFLPGAVGYWMLTDLPNTLNFLKGSAVARLTVYDLSVIPLFLLMGQFASSGGLSRDLFRAAAALVGQVRGGLAMASVLSAGAFGAVCGSSVATCATITQVSYPQMRQHGYSGRLTTATLATGGTLGILIPPSVPLVVFAILTEQNIAKLFAAAMVPGLLAMLGYLVVIALIVRRRPELAPPLSPVSAAEKRAALRGVWPIVLVFAVVFGGIYGGVFSPTEGAGVGAVMTLVLGLLRGEINRSNFKDALLGTAETSAMVFMIFLGADMMNALLALTEVPKGVAAWLSALTLGCVMDELSMIMLTIPVIFPVILGLDFFGLPPTEKAIWFGILILMVVEIGMIFPPVGLNVYIMNGLAKDVPMVETYKGVVPFLISDAVRMTLLILFPGIALWLVRLTS